MVSGFLGFSQIALKHLAIKVGVPDIDRVGQLGGFPFTGFLQQLWMLGFQFVHAVGCIDQHLVSGLFLLGQAFGKQIHQKPVALARCHGASQLGGQVFGQAQQVPRGRIWWRMSDHLPLIAEFRL